MNYRRWSSPSSDNLSSASATPAPFFEQSTAPSVRRCALLPAYPSYERHNGHQADHHLLLANVPNHLLTKKQRRQRKRNAFRQAFILADRRKHTLILKTPSFFFKEYQTLFVEVSQRFGVDNAILDYNYERLTRCMDILMNEQYQCEPIQPLPIAEYPVALEFYLQIDLNVFHMKTCSFRGARPDLSPATGLFATENPKLLYGISPCHRRTCRFCFPLTTLRFSTAHQHRFVNGYRAILNCPATCQTKNLLYALTCPCGQVDYIGYTSMSLEECLVDHRRNGNRIMHEFILGERNIRRVQPEDTSPQTLAKDDMLLYRHSTHCPVAMQLFLDCNPRYWPLIPMPWQQAQKENQRYPIPTPSFAMTSIHTRSDHEAVCCLDDLPPVPSDQYAFSARQRADQWDFFKTNEDQIMPNPHLDLYQATVVALLPDHCSTTLARLVEALFITHAASQLNTEGHLDGLVVSTPLPADRGDWCHDLVRREPVNRS